MKIVEDWMWSSTWPVPEGYERVMWEDVVVGDEVWLLCLREPDEDGKITGTWAKGPVTIVEVEGRKFRYVDDATIVQDIGQRLLRRK